MYNWMIQQTNKKNTHTYSNTEEKAVIDYFGKLLDIEKRVKQTIESTMDAVELELTSLWDNRADIPDEERMYVEEAYGWIKEDGKKLRDQLIERVHSISSEHSSSVFEESMDRLMYHFRRKQKLKDNTSNLETYLEWLLEVPYLIKGRLDSASVLSTIQQHPIMHRETKTITKPVYRGKIELEVTRASSNELALCC